MRQCLNVEDDSRPPLDRPLPTHGRRGRMTDPRARVSSVNVTFVAFICSDTIDVFARAAAARSPIHLGRRPARLRADNA
ncbi:hypothetical protein EVAR_5960_1 [Eumeta japonica]|uniref:Uncharacterized protein n=1 Tax=Eumeta variegata TaxID=151549 RepID=A0A4C1TDF4_EUMVA|nr:hypothetical protein EVAR_5960_1 [Eumeta japonica]